MNIDEYISSNLYLSLLKVKELLSDNQNVKAFESINEILKKLDEYGSYKDAERSK